MFIRAISGIQDYTLLLIEFFRGLKYIRKAKNDILEEMYLIGTKAFIVIAVGGLFIGVILAVEVGHHLQEFGTITMLGKTVSLGMLRELGPIIGGLLFAARTGAKNTSELGAMQLSEQIDAMRAFGTNPVNKLVMPKIIAAVIMFFPLIITADLIGIVSGMLISSANFNLDIGFFWNSAVAAIEFKDLLLGSIKPFFFAFFISSISCYYGFKTKGGTAGLGKATINSVVMSSLMVLILDFTLTKIVWILLG